MTNFDQRPFAAASIGQVHKATLLDGRDVAMKIQVNLQDKRFGFLGRANRATLCGHAHVVVVVVIVVVNPPPPSCSDGSRRTGEWFE